MPKMSNQRRAGRARPRWVVRLAAAAAALLGAAGPAWAQAVAEPPTAEAPAVADPVLMETFEKVWTLVDETHFDPEHHGVDWDAVGDEFRPRAAAATSLDELRGIIGAMLQRLGQSHFVLLPQELVDANADDDDETPAPTVGDGFEGDDDDASDDDDTPPAEVPAADGRDGRPGFAVAVVEDAVVVSRVEPGGPAAKAGVRPGWIVDRVGRRETADLLERMPAGLSESMRATQIAGVVESMLNGRPGTSARVAFRDGDDQPVELEIERAPDTRETVKFGNLPPMPTEVTRELVTTDEGLRIGVIRFNIWMVPLAAEIDAAVEAFRDADGIVVDLRGNPGGVAGMAGGVAGHFVDEREPLGTLKLRTNELNLMINPRRVNAAGERVTPFDGPVVLLTDGGTGSTSEVFAGGLQALGRVRVIGTPSMGAALPAMMTRLPTGDVLLHAFADFLTVDGRSLEGDGVIPDELVYPTRADLLAGRDRPLEAARDWIVRAADDADAPE